MPTILKMMALAAATYCNGSCKNECSIICPVCHRLCREVTPEDWLRAYSDSKYDCGSLEIAPFNRNHKESSTKRPKFKCIICKLVDKSGHEICCGGCFAHDEHARDDTPFDEFEKEANKSLLSNFGEVVAAKLPSCANKTQEELKGIMDAMIALEGYKIEWFSCGWDEK